MAESARSMVSRLGSGALLALEDGDGAALTRSVVLGRHDLDSSPLFDDDGLVAVLDRHPREHLMVFSTGGDPTRPSDWQLVDAGGAGGSELLDAVRIGRLWLNVLHVDRYHADLAELRDRIFAELGDVLPDLLGGTARLTLLVSSPAAIVYYHLDAGPNLLLHIRGTKSIWVYPDQDRSFADQSDVEDIFAGVRIENLPYHRSFDAAATRYDIGPGTLIAWPQNAPHRVENHEAVNVSLAAEFVTGRSRRRQRVWLANRFLSRSLHLPCRATAETGVAPALKTFSYRAAHKLRLERTRPEHRFTVRLGLDPSAPGAVRELPEPFSATY
jgi:hypothetical protein